MESSKQGKDSAGVAWSINTGVKRGNRISRTARASESHSEKLGVFSSHLVSSSLIKRDFTISLFRIFFLCKLGFTHDLWPLVCEAGEISSLDLSVW